MNRSMDSGATIGFDFRVPDHKLIRRIGRGSYGQVWLAQNVMGAFRAVKIVCRKDFRNDVPFQRELTGIRRFEPLSRSHPGFINVLHIGHEAERGYFYYVMELGDDTNENFQPETYAAKTLDSVLRSGHRLAADEILRLGIRLSDALHYLHESGLVHRDIKPANILFVGGLPKLADIGMVAAAEEADSIVGTLGYLPPEGPGSRQADVYALGKVFYEALTGLDRNQFPELPTFFDGHSQEQRFLEINEVINRACHHDLSLRYASARKLHAELIAIENGRSVIRLHELEHSWAKAKRLTGLSAMALLVTGLALFVTIREWNRTERERQQNAGFFTSSSLEAVQNGNLAQALRDTARVISVLPDPRSQEIHRLRYGTILGQIPKVTRFESYGARINWVEFSRDNQSLMLSLGNGGCRTIDVESGRTLIEYVGHTNSVLCAMASPDGEKVATAGADGTARLWERNGRQLGVLPHPAAVNSVDFHPQGNQLVTGCEDGIIRFWEAGTGRLLDQIGAHSRPIDCVRFNHSGKSLVSGGRDNYARLWNTSTKEPAGEPIRHESWVAHAAFSPDDQRLVTSCHDGVAYVWAVTSGSLVAAPLRHERAVRHVEFSPDGRCILTAGWDNVVRQWNAGTGIPEGCALNHSSPPMCASYSADGRRIASGCMDGTLRIWDQAGKNAPRILDPNAIVLSEDGSRYLVRNETNLNVYSTTSSLPPGRVQFGGKLRGSFLSRDGRYLATVTEEPNAAQPSCRIWESQGGRRVSPVFHLPARPTRLVFGHQNRDLVAIFPQQVQLIRFDAEQVLQWTLLTNTVATNACFSNNDRSLAIIQGSQVEVFDCESRQPRFPPLQHTTTVAFALFSPDDKHLLTWISDRDVRACYAQVWNSQTGVPEGKPRWHADGVQGAIWFEDSDRFVTVGEDGIGKIGSLQNGAQIGSDLKHSHEINDVDISSGSRFILTSSFDRSAKLWDAQSSLPIGPPINFPHYLQSIHFSNSDRQLAAHDMNGVIFLASLIPADAPQQFLNSLASLLNGRLEQAINGNEFSTGNANAAAWRQLKTERPSYFTVTRPDAIAWHRLEAERNRALKERRAELFHLDLLLALTPEDRYLTSRRKHVLEVLATEPPSP